MGRIPFTIERLIAATWSPVSWKFKSRGKFSIKQVHRNESVKHHQSIITNCFYHLRICLGSQHQKKRRFSAGEWLNLLCIHSLIVELGGPSSFNVRLTWLICGSHVAAIRRTIVKGILPMTGKCEEETAIKSSQHWQPNGSHGSHQISN